MPDSFCFAEDFLAQLRSGLLLSLFFFLFSFLLSLTGTQKRRRRPR